ncbi:MAG: hypothetical protein LBC97_16355 [Bifidobacteriaceae bacterium]|jgi:hypothetical protein|nr:hypothetical protein [Bifidobacteriaceae bacterium]
MIRRRTVRCWLPLSSGTLAASLVLAGCHGGGFPASPTPLHDATQDTPATGAPTAAEAARLGIPLDTETPLGEYLPYANGPEGSYAAQQALYARNHDAAEQAIAQCMKERGFDYQPEPWEPVPQPMVFPSVDELPLPWLPDTREEVAARGYGKLAAEDYGDSGEDPPKQPYREALNDAGKEAFDLALTGPDPYAQDQADTPVACSLVGQQAASIDMSVDAGNAGYDAFWQEFGDLLLAVNEMSFVKDAKMQALVSEYRSCMLDAGFDIAGGNMHSAEEATPWASFVMALRTKPDGSLGNSWTHYASEEETPADERSLLGTDGERRIAVADFDCRQATDYEAVFLEEYLSWEQDFVDAHKPDLEKMKAYAAA